MKKWLKLLAFPILFVHGLIATYILLLILINVTILHVVSLFTYRQCYSAYLWLRAGSCGCRCASWLPARWRSAVDNSASDSRTAGRLGAYAYADPKWPSGGNPSRIDCICTASRPYGYANVDSVSYAAGSSFRNTHNRTAFHSYEFEDAALNATADGIVSLKRHHIQYKRRNATFCIFPPFRTPR